MKRLAALTCSLVLWLGSILSSPAAVLYQDNFTDGNFTAAEGANGMTWTVVSGAASVAANRLGVRQNRSLVTSDQTVSAPEFTIVFDAWITWGEKGRLVFLYKDTSNYYSVGLGGDPGIFRKMGGVETRLWSDPGTIIRLPHASSATATFKVYAQRAAGGISIKVDKSGDGVDYDAELADTAAAALSVFDGAIKFGMQTTDTSGNSVWFSVDSITVHDSLAAHPRAPLTYYIDATSGDDSRSGAQAQDPATPWKTIGQAAGVMMGGDIAKVLPGVYRETVAPAYSGGRTCPITFQAYNQNHKPVLDGSEIVSLSGWQSVNITDFKGNVHAVFKAPIAWIPSAVYQNNVRMFASQEPDQSDASDQYNLAEFRPVPDTNNPGTSHTDLIDPGFLTQTIDDYWVGATCLLYDGYGNAIAEEPIVDYVPGQNQLVTVSFGQWVWIGRNNNSSDQYAIRNHLGILDRPGEYYVDTTAHEIYVWPYPGQELPTVSAGRYSSAVDLSGGNKSHIEVDGFEIRFYQGSGVNVRSNSNHFTIRNCDIHHNMSSGVSSRFTEGVLIEGCKIYNNYNNGVNLSTGRDYCVSRCEVTGNGNNGVWFGTGGGELFNTENCTVKASYIHHQGGRRMHPDNFQMQQCRYIYLLNNVFAQAGEQNMWTAYCDEYVIANSLYMGGTVGMNATMHSHLYNNIFYNSGLRYDSHLTDAGAPAPTGDYYKPQSAIIRNNIFVECGMAWPAGTVLDRFKVFTIDHNYYNIENSYTYSGWDWAGYQLGIDRGNSLAASTQTFGADYTFWCDAQNTWSDPARLVVLYKDAQNYYSIGMGSVTGIFRKVGGVETRLDPATTVRLPHAGTAASRFQVHAAVAGGIVTLQVDRLANGTGWDVDLRDTLGAAAGTFSSTGVGLMDTTSAVGSPWFLIDNVLVQSGATVSADSFEDGDYTAAQGANGLTWRVISGTARIASKGGTGVGFGAGSIIHRDNDSLALVVEQMPDSLYTTYDFHLKPASPLRDAGVDVGVTTDKDNNVRPMNHLPDIGPYEYVVIGVNDQTPVVREARPLVLLYPHPVKSSAIIRILENNTPLQNATTVRLYTTDGQLAQELMVEHGQARVSADQLKGGMYIVRHREKTIGKIIVVK